MENTDQYDPLFPDSLSNYLYLFPEGVVNSQRHTVVTRPAEETPFSSQNPDPFSQRSSTGLEVQQPENCNHWSEQAPSSSAPATHMSYAHSHYLANQHPTVYPVSAYNAYPPAHPQYQAPLVMPANHLLFNMPVPNQGPQQFLFYPSPHPCDTFPSFPENESHRNQDLLHPPLRQHSNASPSIRPSPYPSPTPSPNISKTGLPVSRHISGSSSADGSFVEAHASATPFRVEGASTAVQEAARKRRKNPNAPDRPACQICQATFARKSNLKDHQIIHTGEKPFSCMFCNQSFARKSDLNRHSKALHPNAA